MLKINKIYSQRDPEWKDILLGFNTESKYTIGDYGCLLSIIATYLTATGKKATPKQLNELLKGVEGYVPGTGLYIWDALRKLYPEYELSEVSKDYSLIPFPETKLKQLEALNEKGFFVILEIDFDPIQDGNQQHFVGISGFLNGVPYVADPWTGTIIPLTVYGDVSRVILKYKVYKPLVSLADEPVLVPVPLPTMPDYATIKKVAWRAARIFVDGVLGVFTVELLTTVSGKEFDDAVKYIVIAGLAGGFAAISKWIRESYGNETKTSLLDKMPF